MAERAPDPTGGLQIVGLGVDFGEVRAVDDLDLTLRPGSFTALLGPSGCGKSTTLASIAGLQTPTRGDVLLDGRSLLRVRPERRPVSLVLQKPLLFPHLNVEQNVAFGLRMQRVSRRRVRTQVAEMLDRVKLGGLGERRVGELSGGQEQRVALARALVLRPRLLLLDEPFSQLDADLRAEMRQLVRGLHDDDGVTTLFVTHDQDEAVELADEIALLQSGRLVGLGSPEDFYARPPSLAAARFFGAGNELHGEVTVGVFRTSDGVVSMPWPGGDGPAALVVRPEAVQLVGAPVEGAAPVDTVAAVVVGTRFAGTHVVVETRLADGQAVLLHVPIGHPVRAGDDVRLMLPRARCTVLMEER